MVLYDELVAEDRRVLARGLASLNRDHLGRRERVFTARQTEDGLSRTDGTPPREPGHDVSPRGNVMRAYATHAATNRANAEQCGARSANPLAPRASC